MKRFLGRIVGLAMLITVAACGSSGNVDAHGSGSWTGSPASSASAQPSRPGDSSAPPAATKPSTAAPTVPLATKLEAETLPPNGELGDNGEGLTIQVHGTCDSRTSKGKGMLLVATGFQPHQQYRTTALYPDESEYTYLVNGGLGMADKNGDLSNWTWNCDLGGGHKDPAGKYLLKIYTLDGRWVATHFTVSYDN